MASGFRKDLQYYRFSLYGFLKNQKFYEPFFLLFLLDKDISYFQAGLLYTIREVTINLLEVPAGVIADSAGRRRSMLISFTFYILSFLLFAWAGSYMALVFAIILFGMGDVFRTGTHKAMIFDYLEHNGWSEHKVAYYGLTRSWSQAGSALSAILAAIIVVATDNYSGIFLFAVIPYLMNIVNLATYPGWLDGEQKKFSAATFRLRLAETFRSLKTSLSRAASIKLYLNSATVSGFHSSVKDYLQPLIVLFAVGLPLLPGISGSDRGAVMAGIIYSLIFIINSLSSRFSGRVAKLTGGERRGLNLTFISVSVLGVLTGVFYHYGYGMIAIISFVLIYSLENIRRPMAVSSIAGTAGGRSLSTWLSVDSQLKSLSAMVLSPLVGLLADTFSPGLGIAGAAFLFVVVFPFIRVRRI